MVSCNDILVRYHRDILAQRSRYREDQPVADSAARLRAGVGRRERNSRRPVVDTDMTFVKKKLRMDFQDNNFHTKNA